MGWSQPLHLRSALDILPVDVVTSESATYIGCRLSDGNRGHGRVEHHRYL